MSVAIRLSRDVEQQINKLDEKRLASLRRFLKRLSENPFAADLLKTPQMDEYERYAYEAPGEFIVYWRPISVRPSDEVPHLDFRDWRIELLQITPLG